MPRTPTTARCKRRSREHWSSSSGGKSHWCSASTPRPPKPSAISFQTAIDAYLADIRDGVFGDAAAFENFRRRLFNRREPLFALMQDHPLLDELRGGRVGVRQQVALNLEDLRTVAELLVAQGEYADTDKPDRGEERNSESGPKTRFSATESEESGIVDLPPDMVERLRVDLAVWNPRKDSREKPIAVICDLYLIALISLIFRVGSPCSRRPTSVIGYAVGVADQVGLGSEVRLEACSPLTCASREQSGVIRIASTFDALQSSPTKHRKRAVNVPLVSSERSFPAQWVALRCSAPLERLQ